MLSIFNTSVLNTFSNTKCAEVFCQTSKHFSIICTFCEMKTFEFTDFLLHFKNVHLDNFSQPLEENSKTTIFETSIKKELEEKLDQNFSESDDQQHEKLSTFGFLSSVENNKVCIDADYSSDNEEKWNEDCVANDSDDKSQPSKRQDNQQFECEFCKSVYKTKGVLKYHIKKFHSSPKPSGHKCNQCDEVSPNMRHLSAHMISVHLGFSCTGCDKKFNSKRQLNRHEVQHTGIKNFACDFEKCGKRFFLRRQLNEHQRIHSNIRSFVCEVCAYTCRDKGTLVVHYRTHTGEKPYACNLCDKRFNTSSMLKEHQPIHSTERPHICDVCGAAFSRPKALYHHKHLHLSIKKFVCKVCENAYAQASGLAAHMRQHKAEQF